MIRSCSVGPVDGGLGLARVDEEGVNGPMKDLLLLGGDIGRVEIGKSLWKDRYVGVASNASCWPWVAALFNVGLQGRQQRFAPARTVQRRKNVKS